MKKHVIIIIIILFIIGVSCGLLIVLNKKEKEPSIDPAPKFILKENRDVPFLADAKKSNFIEDSDVKFIDDKVDTTKAGENTVTLEYYDRKGEIKEYPFAINVVDDEPPLIWLSGSYRVKKGNKNFIDNILCGDNADNKPHCYIEGDYDINKVGNYPVTFKATDKSGNTSSVPFTLIVYDKTKSSTSTPSSGTKIPIADIIKKHKTDKTKIGIDVSSWQGKIDYAKVKQAGIEFVIIRIGTSRGTNGEYVLDSYFKTNYEEAKKNGLDVGGYFFSYADSVEHAKRDADFILENIDGYQFDLPIAFDWEDWSNFNEYEVSFYDLTHIAETFLDQMKEAGYEGMLYGSKTYLENMWLPTKYDTWLAHYTSKTNYQEKYLMWQICSNGSVAGVNGNVDVDILYE